VEKPTTATIGYRGPKEHTLPKKGKYSEVEGWKMDCMKRWRVVEGWWRVAMGETSTLHPTLQPLYCITFYFIIRCSNV